MYIYTYVYIYIYIYIYIYTMNIYVYKYIFLNPLVLGHLSYIQRLTIVNNAIINMAGQMTLLYVGLYSFSFVASCGYCWIIQ
jgi:hypothetical protein